MSKHIVILGYSGSVHIQRWAEAITHRGFKVSVVSLDGEPIENVATYVFKSGGSRTLGYLKNIWAVRKLICNLNPDIVHAHYATGFGLWGSFSGFHPLVLSVWGSDIIDFPKSCIKRKILRWILTKPDIITATSYFLVNKTRPLLRSERLRIIEIPFGVNVPEKSKEFKPGDAIKLVYIKAHEKKYGPAFLLQAMKIVVNQNDKITLTMAGQGSLTEDLKQLAMELGLDDNVNFVGFIDNRRINDFLQEHDIMVMPSIMDSESFGVAVLEASAAGLPVIASKVGGVPEVLLDGRTGILIPPRDSEALAAAIMKLAGDTKLRSSFGMSGREFVKDNYSWDRCVDKMVRVYDDLPGKKK